MTTNLLPTSSNWYRANLHCHTTVSDGHWSPKRIKEEYIRAGYSIVAFSDHNVLVPHADLTDEKFVALTATELDVTTPDIPTDERPEFFETARAGKGWRYLPTHHINLFAKRPDPGPMPFRDTLWAVQHNCYAGPESERDVRSVWNVENVQRIIDEANEAGFFVQYNHPNWSLVEPEHFVSLRGLWALEILNWASEVETGGEYCPYLYDMMMRRTGPSLFCTMCDDNHNHRDDLTCSFGGSTMFAAKELTYGAIVEAMEKGHFYCTEGQVDPPRILAVYVEDDVVHVEATPCERIWMVCDGRRYVNTRKSPVTHAQFPLLPEDHWFRIQLRDARGNNANTHAYSSANLASTVPGAAGRG